MDGDFQTTAVAQDLHNLIVGQSCTETFNAAFGQQFGFTGDAVQDVTACFGGACERSRRRAAAIA